MRNKIWWCIIFITSMGFSPLIGEPIIDNSESKKQNNFKDDIEVVLKNNLEYQRKKAGFELKKINRISEKYRWIPTPDLTLSGNASGNSQTSDSLYALGANLNLKQKLPLATDLILFGGQQFNIDKKDKITYGVGFSSGVKVNVPMFWLMPSLLKDLSVAETSSVRISEEVDEYEFNFFRRRAYAEAVKVIGEYRLLSEFVECDKKRVALLDKMEEIDTERCKQGLMSMAELSEENRKRNEVRRQCLKRKHEFESTYSTVAAMGLSGLDVPYSIDPWLNEKEAVIATMQENGYSGALLEAMKREEQKNSQVTSLANTVPRLSLTASFDPTLKTPHPSSSFVAAMKEYQPSNVSMNWSVSFSCLIALSPFDSAYYVNKMYKKMTEIRSLDEKKNDIDSQREKLETRNKRTYLEKSVTLSQEIVEVESKRLEIVRSLVNVGRATLVDLQHQELVVEEARLICSMERLELIVYVVTFFK